MFEARHMATGEVVRLPGSSLVEGRLVRYDEAAALATELRCEDTHCEAELVHRQGHAGARPHWAHKAGQGARCAASGGPEGEWHQRIKLDVLGACAFHETTVAGARVDAVREHVSKAGERRLYGIEVQHSDIEVDTIVSRHNAHHAAGLSSTLWLLDAARVGAVASSWCDAAEQPHNDYTPLAAGFQVPAQSTTDRRTAKILRAARDSGPHPVSVGFLLDTGTERGLALRLAKEVVVGNTEGALTAYVTKWSAPIDEQTLRGWAGSSVHHPVLNALHQARVVKSKEPWVKTA